VVTLAILAIAVSAIGALVGTLQLLSSVRLCRGGEGRGKKGLEYYHVCLRSADDGASAVALTCPAP
jgi:hypothetical protein